jgi:hypothetical protein
MGGLSEPLTHFNLSFTCDLYQEEEDDDDYSGEHLYSWQCLVFLCPV